MVWRIWCVLIGIGWPALAQTAAGQIHPAGKYQVAERQHSIQFDGIQSNAIEWSEAQTVTGRWYEIAGANADQRAPYSLTFRLLWDADPLAGGLYLWGQSNHVAPAVAAAVPLVTDGSLDTFHFFFDPNLDREDPFQSPVDQPDAYHVAFNIAGPQNGRASLQRLGPGVDTGNIAVHMADHVNSLTGAQGGMTWSGDPASLDETLFQLATQGSTNGWSLEMFMPWEIMDACLGGPNGNGDGLCVTMDTLFGAPRQGDEWLFNVAAVLAGDPASYPSYSAIPSATRSFAEWPHPSMVFVDRLSLSPPPGDLDGDGGVDAADAAIMFESWGEVGLGDLNADGIVDAADASLLLEQWTGDSRGATTSAVPEPLTGVGVGCAWLWLVAARARWPKLGRRAWR